MYLTKTALAVGTRFKTSSNWAGGSCSMTAHEWGSVRRAHSMNPVHSDLSCHICFDINRDKMVIIKPVNLGNRVTVCITYLYNKFKR